MSSSKNTPGSGHGRIDFGLVAKQALEPLME
eukprot:CAMPEP_0114692946 /NCGR_PEP_ID=MMETSP0191-20121206/68491_1 /TAXON_ID=126664 /ORGANISM="Sorites sp." /LENGTH=30 /DNA_ID= /DNA_START= /DNA_END= /DNA_ORIENTATION=